MIREDDVLNVARRAARHMAFSTVIAVGAPDFLSGMAILSLVAGEAFTPEIGGLRRGFGRRVGIVAGAAPHFVTAGALACALCEVFHVARNSQVGRRTGAHEYGEIVGE